MMWPHMTFSVAFVESRAQWNRDTRMGVCLPPNCLSSYPCYTSCSLSFYPKRHLADQPLFLAVLAEMSYPGKPERALSPSSNSNSNSNSNLLSEDDRRDLITRQRNALYGEAPFESGGYVDENGAARPGVPGLSTGPSSHRGPSPLAYDYSRGGPDARRESAGSRNASPQSNPSNNKGPFDGAIHQANRTSNSSPGGSPPRQGAPGQPGAVAPIGTRPSVSGPSNPAFNKQRSTTPLPSPLSQGFNASSSSETAGLTSSAPSNPSSAAPDSYNGWGSRSGVWGKQSSGLGVQASVWG